MRFLFGEVFLFLWVLGMGYVILLCHSLSLPYNYYASNCDAFFCNRSCSLLKKTIAKQTQYDGKITVKKAFQFNLRHISFLKIFLVAMKTMA